MKALVSTALLVSAICLGFVLIDTPSPPRSKHDFEPPPPNAVSTHVLGARSGQIELVGLVAEKDWETACVIKEEDNPLFVLQRLFKQRLFNMKVATTTRPPLDEEWKDHLWKIAIVKDHRVSVYYLDNRRIGRLSEASCMPLQRALLTYEPDEDRVFVRLVDQDASGD